MCCFCLAYLEEWYKDEKVQHKFRKKMCCLLNRSHKISIMFELVCWLQGFFCSKKLTCHPIEVKNKFKAVSTVDCYHKTWDSTEGWKCNASHHCLIQLGWEERHKSTSRNSLKFAIISFNKCSVYTNVDEKICDTHKVKKQKHATLNPCTILLSTFLYYKERLI